MIEQGRKTPETVETLIHGDRSYWRIPRERVSKRRKTHPRIRHHRPKKVWRKGLARTESWKTGRVSVIRNKKGLFVKWHKIRVYAVKRPKRKARKISISRAVGQKRIAVYGNRNGKHKRWVIVGRGGQKHYEAVREAYIHSPRKQFTIVDADTMLDHEEDYIEGYWDDKPTIEPEY